MHSVYGRLLSRSIVNGLYNCSSSSSSSGTSRTAVANTTNENVSPKSRPKLVSAVAGFPKSFKSGKVRKGQIGDDAWLVKNVDSADVLAVADGVGGWRDYGVDPSDFSLSLLRSIERITSISNPCNFRNPVDLLSAAFHELLHSKRPITGSSTACILILEHESNNLFTVNIGDSGFLVVRKGQVVHKSEEQQHYFNTPFQLALPPPGHHGSALSDSPQSASQSQFAVQDGDVILLATDGVFDNVPQPVLVAELSKLGGVRDQLCVQKTANSIALMARNLSFDGRYMSPFAQRARDYGIRAVGGKPDDITVLLATVAI